MQCSITRIRGIYEQSKRVIIKRAFSPKIVQAQSISYRFKKRPTVRPGNSVLKVTCTHSIIKIWWVLDVYVT